MPIWTSYGALYITSNVSLTHLGLYGLLSELTPLLHWFPDIPASLYMYINQINVISEQQSETEVLDAHDLELVDEIELFYRSIYSWQSDDIDGDNVADNHC